MTSAPSRPQQLNGNKLFVVKRLFYIWALVTTLGILNSGDCVGQVNSDNAHIQIIDGRKYYVHTVGKGETLYGISKKYGVEVKDIVLENPLSINGLKLGQTIKIPVPIKVVSTKALDGKFFYHQVQPGETFYALARQYSVSVENIKLANPEIVAGLKANTTIRIPVTKKIQQDNADIGSPGFADNSEEAVEDTAAAEISSLADSVVDTMAAESVIRRDTIMLKNVYHVALMLPLYLDINDSIDKKRKPEDEEIIFKRSNVALEFYEGARMAIDSMHKMDFNARIYVYDTENDTAVVKKLMLKSEMKKMDLIVGPLYRSNLNYVVAFAKKHEIEMVSPLITTNRILNNHPNLSKVKPCVQTSVKNLASYVFENYVSPKSVGFKTNNIVIIHNSDPGEQLLANLFIQSLTEWSEKPNDSGVVETLRLEYKIIDYSDREMEAVEEALSIADSNIIIVPSRDQVFVSKLISQLYRKNKSYGMEVYGLPVWRFFSNLESDQLHRLNVHIPSPTYIDYADAAVKKMTLKFSEKYNSYPSRYAFEGFDVMFYYLNVLKKYGHQFQSFLPEISWPSLQSDYTFERLGKNSGYENTQVFILKYKDYELVNKTPRIY
ncbi:MAG TPA: LysM peptidoglycan-binding domain-containing protein [Flavobacteriales bacterium]|nr:LysM peptidoglycan-binding domain-containing protein [Flavobacteriales bacterium]